MASVSGAVGYGIAHLMDEGARAATAGSQGYIAPEHFTGEIGPPADIFAVGVMLFSMLAGVKPASVLKSPWPVPAAAVLLSIPLILLSRDTYQPGSTTEFPLGR